MNQESDLILLVEDNESHALLVKRALLESEFKSNVVHVFDGEDALDFLYSRNRFSSKDTRMRPRPKIILLDLRLPRMDGLEVLKIVKTSEEFYDIPVVILTSSMAEPDVVGAYHFRANSYLVKPVDFALFRRQILDAVNYWLNWNITPLL
ncbi:MAG: response regulator [Chitinispirillales bacterium]|nr:response regulator [Chitinispirillales bacterium]